ncbi:hypothetical protein FJ422_29775 [Mesorhizobium sp. B2-6-3]|uniref:hypothetical protein n=1 Tax=Mesorhizobium sp. B2-6-3 TaxID=2589914 RepID=UPI001129E40B|nr:hypothetical protein [Mesorhizobium sp. B2-6-3]TPJ76899.1 hypothetical protein FJ422_29775 [Mesorhizobium sp. B2-6-3]
MADWQPIKLSEAPENVTVLTKIDDADGARNIQELRRQGSLWWYPDMSMYVYYQPTHWAQAPSGE